MKILFVSALFLAIAASGVYSQACHMREIDLCTAMGMFHYQSNGVPSDEEKLAEWCDVMKEVSECSSNFSTKCMSPLQRELSSLLSGSDDETSKLCVAGSEKRARFLQHAECLAEGAESDEFKGYLRDLQVMVEKLFDVPYKQRFPLLCCGFRRYYLSSDAKTRRDCGDEAVDLVHDIMNTVISDIPEVICQRFDPESDECIDLLPATGTLPRGGENKSQLSKLLETVLGNS